MSRTLANATVEETDRAAERLVRLIGQLGSMEPPRVLIHIGPRTRYSDATLGGAIVRAANEHLVRIYHYPNNDIPFSAGRESAVHVGIAKPTGGKSFSNTEPPKKVAARIAKDLQCFYLLTFESADLVSDEPLEVFVRSRARKTSVSTRRELILGE